MKKNILITGASSDIGISVVEKYIEDGWSVTAHFNKNNKRLKKLKTQNHDLDLFYFDFKDICNYLKRIHEAFLKHKEADYKNAANDLAELMNNRCK